MANFRPAGLSDSESDSDDYGFYEKPIRKYIPPPQQVNPKKKIELNLQDAILNGNLKEIEKIITCDLSNNVNIKLDSGWTPLMHACFHAQDKIVELLLSKGADPNLHADSVTPVMAACSNSSADNDTIYNIISTLLEKDCILNIGDKYGQTPLMRAIGSGRVAVVQKLIDMKVNIEMRDQQGWTATFWAVHHNQPEILQILIENGARLTEVDRSNRTLLDIASSHDYENIIEILNKHLNKDEDKDKVNIIDYLNVDVTSWHSYYPGLKKDQRLDYKAEIPHLLYGMNCERLLPKFHESGMDLRTFLLMEEEDMLRLGIDMPYERQRLISGLRNFHMKSWKLNAVAGLYARRNDNYSVLDCLSTLGTHLEQIYILEATLQYVIREYNKVEDQIKFEPPNSPVVVKMKATAKKMLTNIHSIRKEIKTLKPLLYKINKNNPQPADVIKEPSALASAFARASEIALVCSIGLLAYNARTIFSLLLKK